MLFEDADDLKLAERLAQTSRKTTILAGTCSMNDHNQIHHGDDAKTSQLRDLDHRATASTSPVQEPLNNLPPVHRLPPELMGTIFALTLPCRSFLSSGYTQPDIAGVSVCRRWHSISYGTPSLWTVVEVPTSADPQSTTVEYLERSGGMPLCVSTQYPPTDPTTASLASQANRIHELFLEIPDKWYRPPQTITQLFPAVPNLECLVLAIRNLMFMKAPRIPLFARPPRRVRVLIVKRMWCDPAILYGHLTHLHITACRFVDLPSFLAVLGSCTALEQLVMADVQHRPNCTPEHTSPSSVPLPVLRTLTLGNPSHQSL
ncbi:hypothetical protein FKP32DRAFT_1675079, partial [Trametes sanguinea]